MQGVMLAHGLATKTFCDLVKQLKRYIPIHSGAQGTVQIKICAKMQPSRRTSMCAQCQALNEGLISTDSDLDVADAEEEDDAVDNAAMED